MDNLKKILILKSLNLKIKIFLKKKLKKNNYIYTTTNLLDNGVIS